MFQMVQMRNNGIIYPNDTDIFIAMWLLKMQF